MKPTTILSLALILAVVPRGRAEDVTFTKARYSSPKQRRETDIDLSLTDSKILIKGKKASDIDIAIPYSSIQEMSYELATRHRVKEGAAVMVASLGAGAVLMATKTKSHWLDIEYTEGGGKQVTVLRLDKTEYKSVLAAVESKTGKKITTVDAKTSNFNPTAESRNMDKVVPFVPDKVAAALKVAMEDEGCKVTEQNQDRIECKRARGGSERTGSGGEKITARLEAQGGQTRVRIETGKGFVGRLGKKNWSTAIYDEMMKALEKPAPRA